MTIPRLKKPKLFDPFTHNGESKPTHHHLMIKTSTSQVFLGQYFYISLNMRKARPLKENSLVSHHLRVQFKNCTRRGINHFSLMVFSLHLGLYTLVYKYVSTYVRMVSVGTF